MELDMKTSGKVL